MDEAAPELNARYRRFLDGRGDAIAPLICFLRGERGGARGDSRAWAALFLCRIYLLKGRLDLAESYLRLSLGLFRSPECSGIPLLLWIDRAVLLKWRGSARRAEALLRIVFSRAVRSGDSPAAAEAASHLALVLAETGRLDEATSFLACAERGYRALRRRDGLFRVELAAATIDFERGRHSEAIERAWTCAHRTADPVLGCTPGGSAALRYEAIAGALLLLEWSVRLGDEAGTARCMRHLAPMMSELDRFRLLRLSFLYLQHESAARRGDHESARSVERAAERLRAELGVGAGCFAVRRRGGDEAQGGDDARDARQEDILREVPSEAGIRYGPLIFGARSGGRSNAAPVLPRRREAGIVTQDARMLGMIDDARRSAPLPFPVLIEGETGSGKELLARMIHALSGRSRHPFIPVNIAAIPNELFESELFGHVRGAFTGAAARRIGLVEAAGEGTLFLDEIGELGPAMQAKLLRLLDGGEYYPLGQSAAKLNCARIVAATNRDLAAAVEAGEFRRDLFYRLKVFGFRIPPLRERRGDVPLLVRHFLGRCCERFDLGPLSVSDASLDLLLRHRWPGNVRELEFEVIRAAVRRRRGVLRVCDFSVEPNGKADGPGGSAGDTLAAKLAAFERAEIQGGLRDAGGNRTRAAALLGIKRTTLLSRMKRFGLE